MMVFEMLIEPLQRALEHEGYTVPTPIQEQAIPPLLEGKDLLGIAQTGTGKTAAFLLPILQRLSAEKRFMPPSSPRVLILAPTRELAAQIDASCAAYGKFLRVTHAVIFGGVGQGPQVSALRHGADILVATPGRLLDLHQQGLLHLEKVEIFVLDEADRMLDMGFIHDVKKIVALIPRQRQTMLFSATMPGEVAKLAATMLRSPVRVEVAPQATTVEKVEQRVLFVDREKKPELLLSLLEREHLEKVLVFTKTKHGADKVARILKREGIHAAPIHGNRSQNQRTQALAHFQGGKVRVLVATDIAARGIDVEDISHVINYDLPTEPETYVHRIGRTARAGKEGTAYSFCAADERDFLRDIEKLTRMKITQEEHPFHSERAKSATGAAARPKPRQQRPPRRASGQRRGGTASTGQRRQGGQGQRHGGQERRGQRQGRGQPAPSAEVRRRPDRRRWRPPRRRSSTNPPLRNAYKCSHIPAFHEFRSLLPR